MPASAPYLTVPWTETTQFYQCICGFARFHEPTVAQHCATCPHLTARASQDEPLVPVAEAPPDLAQEG